MGQRGPKSGASMSVVPSGQVEAMRRVKPPAKLNDSETALFCAIVDSLPADWIGVEAVEGLANYCRHSVEVDYLTDVLAAMKQSDDFDVDQYRKISQLRHAESGRANELGRALRLFPQSTVNHKTKKGKSSIPKPWQK